MRKSADEGTEDLENLEDLEKAIGYHFQDPELALLALTHSSYARENAPSSRAANEQMEFLGDSILGFLVSEALFRQIPECSEGRLSKLKAHLVSAAHLDQAARQIGLSRYLRLGRGEEQSGGREKKALRVDALEALVAAVYMDGGLETARRFVERWILEPADWRAVASTDYKSELQELLQARRELQPRYVVVEERGPEHSKSFTVELRVGRKQMGRGTGDSKKAAQQAAARVALARLKEETVGGENQQED